MILLMIIIIINVNNDRARGQVSAARLMKAGGAAATLSGQRKVAVIRREVLN
jgi:hypothetical protein